MEAAPSPVAHRPRYVVGAIAIRCVRFIDKPLMGVSATPDRAASGNPVIPLRLSRVAE